jgi:hypothetical protein
MKIFSFSLFVLTILIVNAFAQNQSVDPQNNTPQYYIGKTLTIKAEKGDKLYGFDNYHKDITKEIYFNDKNIVFKIPHKKASEYDSLANRTFVCQDAGSYPKDADLIYFKLYNPQYGVIYYVNFAIYDQREYFSIMEEEQAAIAKKAAIKIAASESRKQLQVAVSREQEERIKNMSKTVDSLRTAYIGKPVWLKTNVLYTYNENTKVYDLIKSNNLLVQAATVNSVALSPSPVNPFRITIKTAKGITGYYDFDYEHAIRTTTKSVDNYPVNNKQIVEFRAKLSEILFTRNPITMYNLTPVKIAAIRKGDIYIGMDKISVSLIRGEPDKINYTTTAYVNYEQWVYNIGDYYYFENGKLVTVQN